MIECFRKHVVTDYEPVGVVADLGEIREVETGSPHTVVGIEAEKVPVACREAGVRGFRDREIEAGVGGVSRRIGVEIEGSEGELADEFVKHDDRVGKLDTSRVQRAKE